jgi:hypothetical protein
VFKSKCRLFKFVNSANCERSVNLFCPAISVSKFGNASNAETSST